MTTAQQAELNPYVIQGRSTDGEIHDLDSFATREAAEEDLPRWVFGDFGYASYRIVQVG